MNIDKQLLKDTIGWGALLWLIGYVLGIVLFAFVPPPILGWIIMPIGMVITLWVLFKRIKSASFWRYVLIALAWTLIAVVFDYLFLVLLFKPADGYYKTDVYLYYALTLAFPLAVGLLKRKP